VVLISCDFPGSRRDIRCRFASCGRGGFRERGLRASRGACDGWGLVMGALSGSDVVSNERGGGRGDVYCMLGCC
jgi:hypothetical protein